MPKRREPELTTPDLVLLSLLSEKPMHGYQANLELERRQVREWAGISRPQIYYSLEKLARAGLVSGARDREVPAGPERHIYRTTAKGHQALAKALGDPRWTQDRQRPAFLTWLALSWQASPGVAEEQVRRRRVFLEEQLNRTLPILEGVRQEVGHDFHEAVWMLTLTIEQFRTELRWLDKLERELPHRAPAKNPDLVQG